jgi:hypothetical protein
MALAGCAPDARTTSGQSDPAVEIREDERQDKPQGDEESLLHPDVLTAPPPVTVRNGAASLELEAFTFCFENGCVDGSAPETLPDIGPAPELRVEFPLDGWTFDATFTPAEEDCGRQQTVTLERTGDGSFALLPAGRAGTYDVSLFGRARGDLVTDFRWTTTADGPLPRPSARLAVLADHDGEIDSYGVELQLVNLAATPAEATASITVTAADGTSSTFDPLRPEPDCLPTGTVYWEGPDEAGKAAAELGPAPFTYRVDLVLDGVRHTGTATWPDDQIVGNEPSAQLTFEPALPAVG